MYDLIVPSSLALVVQWIELPRPKGSMSVRFWPRAPQTQTPPKGGFLFSWSNASASKLWNYYDRVDKTIFVRVSHGCVYEADHVMDLVLYFLYGFKAR